MFHYVIIINVKQKIIKNKEKKMLPEKRRQEILRLNNEKQGISIKDLAYKINKIIPSKIKIVTSNDPRSYRQSSKKLLSMGFIQKYSVEEAILDLKQRYQLNKLVSLDKNYNVKWMKLIKIDGKRN